MSTSSMRRIFDVLLFRGAGIAALLLVIALSAQAQRFQVIHNFSRGSDGAFPSSGLTMDQEGNLWGTTAYGGRTYGDCGITGCGTIYKISNTGLFSTAYAFPGGANGAYPSSPIEIGPDGAVYGNLQHAGRFSGGWAAVAHDWCGVVFGLLDGQEEILYQFTGIRDGSAPTGSLVFDRAGNIYGNTYLGGHRGSTCPQRSWGCGTVFQLTKTNDTWTETTLYSFRGDDDGASPQDGPIIDSAGNLYGITALGGGQGCGGAGCGTIFELSPSQSGWTEKILYRFQGGMDGAGPNGGLVMDPAGNLYGTTAWGLGSGCGGGGCGGVFQLSASGDRWVLNTLHRFNWDEGSRAPLSLDSAGNVYGTAFFDGASGDGSVFRLTRSGSTWTYTSLHDFTGGADGSYPVSDVTIDAGGSLYGTTSNGGTGQGVVWKISF